MGPRDEQISPLKRHMNSKEAYEKSVHYHSKLGDAYQNNNKISSYASKNSTYPISGNSQCWRIVVRKEPLCTVGGNVT